MLFGQYGDDDWRGNSNNIDGFRHMYLRPRVLRDVSTLKLNVEVLGSRVETPIMVGPSGMHQRFHEHGEIATVSGTGKGGALMALSTASSFSIEEVAAGAGGPLWFQLYLLRDRGLTQSLVERAERAGYRALVVTVDNPGMRSHERDNRYGYAAYAPGQGTPLQPERVLRNFHGTPNLPENLNDWFDAAADWSRIEWLRSISRLPIVVKGIQTAEDAKLCVQHGVSGVVVSNHGGHALWDARASVETLPEIVDAVAGDLEVYVDGGIRRGTDVLKCLALGARATFIVRAYLWGLSVSGAEGVEHVLWILAEELKVAMAYCGISDVGYASGELVHSTDSVLLRLRRLDDARRLVVAGKLSQAEMSALESRLFD